jgi:minor extracellular serine protease Vpr
VICADTDHVSGRVYKYAILGGTSMSSPCASGIVAMMLQLNPTLTPDMVKDIINNIAIKDAFTGALPVSGNYIWGHGKINAYGAVSYIVEHESVERVNMDAMDCILYPNPNNGGFTISYNSKIQEQLTIEVCNAAGAVVLSQVWQIGKGGNTKQFNTGALAKGIYFTRITAAHGHNVIRMVTE